MPLQEIMIFRTHSSLTYQVMAAKATTLLISARS